MSSVKRSSLVSSELSQLKGPDKWETTTSKINHVLAANSAEVTFDTMPASVPTKTQTQQQSRDAQKSGSSTQEVTKNFDLDESELKNLLDEAYSYKGPKDKENKSEIFKELLHKAELEDQQRDTRDTHAFFSSSQFRGNNRRHHTGGSLQDLVDSVNNEQLDCDYRLGPQLRRHQQNSRYTKNSSSVSSRQREGGSLPNNVNSSSGYPISTFLSKYPKTNAKNSAKIKSETYDYERNSTNHHRSAFMGESVSYCEEIKPSIASTSASVIQASDKNHTIINIDDLEESRHLLAHDSLAQETAAVHRDDGTELVSIKKRIPTMNYLLAKDISETSRHCSVDAPIHFLKNSTAVSGSDPPIGTKVFGKSPIDQKYTSNRHVHLNPITVNQNKLDENGNAILQKPTTIALASNHQPKVKPKRSNKADRNTKTWTAEGPQGSEYNIDSLVAFIENKDVSRKTNIINVNKNNLSATERTRKEKNKNTGNSKKEVDRLKKSTSMEELKSSSKIEEEIAQSESAQVSLRQKHLQNAQKRSTTVENPKQQSNKRGERRSWGTEELNDFDPIEDRETKKHKENKSSTKSNKKTEQMASTNASIESIPTNIEAAEFHVVTKKKKTKKRQILEEAKAKQQQNQRDQMPAHGRTPNSNTASSGNKYQPSSIYTNDRDIYVNSLTTKENRRKSTSSVPPSVKSDSSDLDSVHSLPIESTTTCTSSIISYAEIARKANQQEKLANINAWPSVSQNGKNSESPENLNISTSSSTVSSKSHVSNRSQDTIKASSPNDDRSASNSDDSRVIETPVSQPKSSEFVKNHLQKSKSCDNEKSAAMSLDQFPGLEKTVKPQKSHPNFASILTSPPTIANEKPLPTKGQLATTKKSPPPMETSVLAPKESTLKAQKSVEEKPDNKTAIDTNCSKLQFLQNSAKAEDIANSDSSNLFAPINVKKTKKSQPNAVITQRSIRQTAVIFSDRETNHENVSPLQFGDFNDDILQLMKQEENHVDNVMSNGPSSMTESSTMNAYESADYSAMNDCNQSKPNIHTPMMSSQSDPGYTSAHRTTAPTESHEVVNKVHMENHIGNSTTTELLSKKSNVTKKNLNKFNVNNNKISDVVSNQSLNNNNNMINNVSLSDTTANAVSFAQSISESDSLNNNINKQMNDKNRNHNVDGDVMKLQSHHQQHQYHNDADVTKLSKTQNNVNSIASKPSNQSAANQQPKGVITYDNVNVNNRTADNISNGPLTNKLSSTECEVIPVDSHSANISHNKFSSFFENGVPAAAHSHNHTDIVHFVGSAWEEVKYGRPHYFSGQ